MNSQHNSQDKNISYSEQNPIGQPASPTPPQSATPFSFWKKLNKKNLILLAVLAFSVLISFFIKSYFLGKQPENSQRQNVIITEGEWENIKKEISGGYVYRYLNQQFQREPEFIRAQPNSTAEGFFISAHQYADIPPENTASGVLGEFTDSDSPGQELSSSLVKLRLGGTINNEEYDVLITNLMTQDRSGYGGISDVLINGRIGDLQLGDPYFDALHLSVIEPNQSSAYIKASVSDIFLIVLDRIINGPDPESENSGIISAQYDDVYPYFDHYVEVVSEAKDEEILAEELSVYLKEYGDFGRQAFQATLGDLDSYLTKEKSYLDVMAGEPIVRLEMKANASALFNQIKTFLTEMDNYAKDRKTIYEPYCQTGSIEDQRDCLISFGYVSEDVDYTFLSGLAFLVNFDKLDVILDADNKDFLGIDLSISLKQTAFELLKKTFPGETGGLANINSLNFQLAFRDMPPQKIKAIEKPSSYFRFLPEGEDFVVDRETKSDTEKLAEQLFLINYNYVWETELEKLSQDKTTYCQEKWEPNFCLEMNANWREDYLAYSADSFEFLYFPYYDLLRGKEISFKFKNDQNVGEGLFCDGEKYDDFYEIKTQDGLVFRINRLATNDQSQEFLRDDFLVDVCYQNPDGKFTTVSPLARSIELYSQHMTFEELCQKVGVILETIKLQDPSQADLTQEYSQVFEGSETLFLGGAKGDPNSCSVSFYRDQNSFSRAYENIKKDFSIEREFNDIVIEENTVFCQWAETTEDKYCLKCVGGKLEWTEMDDCRGLSCNP
jgi:hypothetical protein